MYHSWAEYCLLLNKFGWNFNWAYLIRKQYYSPSFIEICEFVFFSFLRNQKLFNWCKFNDFSQSPPIRAQKAQSEGQIYSQSWLASRSSFAASTTLLRFAATTWHVWRRARKTWTAAFGRFRPIWSVEWPPKSQKRGLHHQLYRGAAVGR